MDDYVRRQNKLHECHVLLLEEVKRICKKHGLQYFAIAGTLLGAVRHQGAIPWDDDMDLGMLREEYDKFLEAAGSELDCRFFLQNIYTDPGYGLNFSKLLLRDTVMIERNSADNSACKGIYIDIFPLDNAPDDVRLREKQDKSTYFLKRLLLAKQGYKVYDSHDTKKKLAYGILWAMAAFSSKERICARLEAAIQKYNAAPTQMIVNVGGAYGYRKEMLRRDWFHGSVELPFENTTISAPAEYAAYLTYFYGDYMTPPPENKRGDRHSILLLDFGPYQ